MKIHLSQKLIGVTTLLSVIVGGCSLNYTESGKEVDPGLDQEELLIAKRSLRLIDEEKVDSLRVLFDHDVAKNINPDRFTWIITNGNRIMESSEYPNDSIVTVSTTTTKSLIGQEVVKELNFPFINTKNPDSTRYFKITISDGKISKLLISTGRRYKLQ